MLRDRIMLRLIVALTAALAIASLPKLAAAEDTQLDPVSVMKHLFEARNSANPDAAVALFAVDAEVVNAVGARLTSMDAIRRFMAGGIAQKGRYEVEDIRYEGGVVRWKDLVTNDVYRKLAIAPVEVVGEAVVDQGKIKSFITHFPSSSMEKFERACEGAKADGILIVGLTCPKFLRGAKAQMLNATAR
jgi:hypothetical protein